MIVSLLLVCACMCTSATFTGHLVNVSFLNFYCLHGRNTHQILCLRWEKCGETSPALNWLYQGHSVYWRGCCRIWCKMSAHALFLRGWNVLPQLQLSQTKSQDIFNCSLFSTKCARASGERWRLLLWQLAQNNSQCSGGPGFRQYFSISVNSPVCIPHFVNWQK